MIPAPLPVAPMAMLEREPVESKQNEMPNIGAAMWRYRWAVALPTMLGMMAGFLVFIRTPETYRSTTRLMIESDRPAVMDVMTGQMVGSVPSIEIIQSELFSDWVITQAFNDGQMANFHDQFEEGYKTFVEMVKDGALELESEVSDTKTAQSVVALLHFDSPDKDLSQAAVRSFSNGLQAFYNNKYSNTQDELRTFIKDATQNLKPELDRLEAKFSNFRKTSKLDFDQDGRAVNPHRVIKQQLIADRVVIEQDLFDAVGEYDAIRQTVEAASDPITALSVVSQYLGSDFRLPDSLATSRPVLGADDAELALLSVAEELAPIMAQRDSLAAALGTGHPSVRQLDLQVSSLETRLNDLRTMKSSRIGVLINGAERQENQAEEAVKAVIQAAKIRATMLQSTLVNLNKKINQELVAERNLANKEVEYMELMRRIDGNRELMAQISESMARVEISSSSESETSVGELTAASIPYLVAPIIWKLVGIGGFLGLGLGAGMAFLLEKNANTFRDPDEISTSLGVPVLTHVPFFKKLSKKSKNNKDSPYRELDPCLAVLHSPSSVVAESIRSLRTAIFFEMSSTNGKIIQLTSPLPGDGKSTLAGNLACAIAQSGKSVLAIDCDLRRPQFTDNFMLQDKLGLTNILNGEAEWHEACHSTPLPHLDVMPSGPIPANPAEALTLPEMADLLDSLREHYDYIIIDTPPLLVVTDPSILASMVDGVVLALRVRRKSKLNAKEAVNILRAVGGNLLGTIINNSDESSSSDGYRGYGYYRYSRYAKKYYRRGGTAGEVVPRGSKKRSGMVVGGRITGNADGRPVSPAARFAEELSASAATPTAPSVPNAEADSNEQSTQGPSSLEN